jgi:mRNA interferase RelE/StbE
MAWKVELSPLALKGLEQVDRQGAQRILRFLFERVSQLDNPRSIGEALKGSQLGNYWKYRVGDYRIIANFEDDQILIQVVRIGNRKEVYR